MELQYFKTTSIQSVSPRPVGFVSSISLGQHYHLHLPSPLMIKPTSTPSRPATRPPLWFLPSFLGRRQHLLRCWILPISPTHRLSLSASTSHLKQPAAISRFDKHLTPSPSRALTKICTTYTKPSRICFQSPFASLFMCAIYPMPFLFSFQMELYAVQNTLGYYGF